MSYIEKGIKKGTYVGEVFYLKNYLLDWLDNHKKKLSICS